MRILRLLASSLQAKLGAFFIGSILVTSLIHVWNGMTVTTRELTGSSEYRMLVATRNEAAKLQSLLTGLQNDMAFLRDLPPTMFALKPPVTPGKSSEDEADLWATRLAITVQGLMKSKPQYSGFILVRAKGERAVDVRRSDGDIELLQEDNADETRMTLVKQALASSETITPYYLPKHTVGPDTLPLFGYAAPIRLGDETIGALLFDLSLAAEFSGLDSLSHVGGNFILSRYDSSIAFPVNRKDSLSGLPKFATPQGGLDSLATDLGKVWARVSIPYLKDSLSGPAWTLYHGEDLDVVLAGVRDYKKRSLLVFVLTLLVISVICFFMVRSTVIQPLKKAVAVAQAIEKGDLSESIHSKSNDEIGVLLNSVEKMRLELSQIVRSIRSGVLELTTASQRLGVSAEELDDGFQTVSSRAESVLTVSTRVGKEIEEVSRSGHTVGDQVTQVSDAVKQLSSSFDEVSRHCVTSYDMATDVRTQSESTRDLMQKLKQSAEEVQGVLGTLDKLVGTTKLLALNASIEAASAGDAGRGFAVVAGEVRNLAEKSRNSQTMIGDQIRTITDHIRTAVQGIDVSYRLISELNGLSQNISASVTEQTTIANQVAENLHEADQNTQSIIGRIHEANQGIHSILESVKQVTVSLKSTTETIANNRAQAKTVTTVSEQLDKWVARFKVSA
jgi:methyl-accepting chemotaxis protein